MKNEIKFSDTGHLGKIVYLICDLRLNIKNNACWAGDGSRTRDVQLGKLTFYHWITPAYLNQTDCHFRENNIIISYIQKNIDEVSHNVKQKDQDKIICFIYNFILIFYFRRIIFLTAW